MPIDDKVHLRHCILYEYQRGHKVSAACRNLCRTFGEDVITRSTVDRWFVRFREGDLSLKDGLKGRPAARLKELVQKAIEQDPTQQLKTDTLEKLHIQL